MAEKDDQQQEQAKPEKAADGSAQKKPKEAAESAEKFSVADIISGGLGGLRPHVLAGAYAGEEDQKVTLEEAAERCEKWLNTPVKEA